MGLIEKVTDEILKEIIQVSYKENDYKVINNNCMLYEKIL